MDASRRPPRGACRSRFFKCLCSLFAVIFCRLLSLASVRGSVFLEIAGRELIAEGADLRVQVLTMAAGQAVPWHYHSEISDTMVCLEGPMVVETRAPRMTYVLSPGERCAVPPMTAHYVHGLNDGPCEFLILQGAGEYDNVLVGGQPA